MRRIVGTFIAVAAASSLPFASSARADDGFFLAASAGYNFAPDWNFSGDRPFSGAGVPFDLGFSADARLGWQRGHWRWEFIGSFEQYRPPGSIASGFNVLPTHGSASSYGLLAASSYQFSPIGGLEPYVGVGLGAATMVFDVDIAGLDYLEGVSTNVAARAFAGSNFKLRPGASLFIEGRYQYLGPFEAHGLYLHRTADTDDVFANLGMAVGLRFPLTRSNAPAPRTLHSEQPFWAVSVGFTSPLETSFFAGGPPELGEGYGAELRYGWRNGHMRWEAIGSFARSPARGDVTVLCSVNVICLGGGIGLVSFSFGGFAESYSLLAAGSYEFTPRGAIQPYVGAALGLATMALDITFEGRDFLEGSATSLAARGFAGASIKLTRDTSLFVEGRYNFAGPFQLGGANGLKFDDSFRGWGAGVGLRFAI